MLRRLFSAAALLLLLTCRAEAAPINLLLTVDLREPIVGQPREISFGFLIFESATNLWPSFEGIRHPFDNHHLLPGVWQFNVAIDAASLDNFYITGFGRYKSFGPGLPPPPHGVESYYVAEPPTGYVSDALAWYYGPPWIPLANMGDGMSGDFSYINGYSRGAIGTWAISPVPDEAPVPEPASLLLLGSGLAAVMAKKYRQSKAGRGH